MFMVSDVTLVNGEDIRKHTVNIVAIGSALKNNLMKIENVMMKRKLCMED